MDLEELPDSRERAGAPVLLYSLCTDHAAQMTCVHGSRLSCVPKIGHPSTRHVSPCASQHTEHQHKFSLSLSHLPLLCYCRLLLRTQTCCPRIHVSTVKIHGRMVLVRNSTPPQVMSPRGSSSTGFWPTHKIKELTTRMILRKLVSNRCPTANH